MLKLNSWAEVEKVVTKTSLSLPGRLGSANKEPANGKRPNSQMQYVDPNFKNPKNETKYNKTKTTIKNIFRTTGEI